MDDHIYNSPSASADPTAARASAGRTLDSLILPTFKELKEAHYRIAAESREARERAGREFRTSQSGIYDYLTYAPPTLRVLAYENALLCSFARHLCAALEARFGRVPVLRVEDLLAAEDRAKTLLAHHPTSKQVEKLGAVQFAVGGILGVHYFDGIKVVPERKRVLTKVLTLLMCFSAAIRDRHQQPAADQPVTLPSHEHQSGSGGLRTYPCPALEDFHNAGCSARPGAVACTRSGEHKGQDHNQ